MANSLLQFLENSFRRTGSVANKFATETIVPLCHQHLMEHFSGTFAEATFLETMFPLWSYSSFVARGASSRVAVVMVTSERAHSELIASPLNPNVSNSSKFSKVEIFEV